MCCEYREDKHKRAIRVQIGLESEEQTREFDEECDLAYLLRTYLVFSRQERLKRNAKKYRFRRLRSAECRAVGAAALPGMSFGNERTTTSIGGQVRGA
jgi:hypothetical protein